METQQATPRGESTSERLVVTLVHGTWASNAAWVRAESSLSRALLRRFGSRVELHPFPWSGSNSHSARRRASHQLQEKLSERLNSDPSGRHFLICHSHGGNVALRALVDGLNDRMTGVVCLATPFLVARRRDLGQHPWKHLAGALAVLLLLLISVTHLVMPDTWPELGRATASVVVSALVMGAFATVVRRWRTYTESLLAELRLPAVTSQQLLIVRSPADEASAALALFQFVSQVTVRMLLLILAGYTKLEVRAERWTQYKMRVLAAAAGAFLLTIGLIIVVALVPERWPGWPVEPVALAGAMVALFAGVSMLYLLFGGTGPATVFARLAASAVVWPVVGLLSLLLLPLGWETAVANILLDVTAEPTPPGSWTVHLVEPPTSSDLGTDVVPLMHSVIYDNPRVLDLICDWIETGHCGVPPSSPSGVG